MKKIFKNKGFTLIELLIIIAIIGILSSIILSSLNSSRAKADVAFVKQQSNQIQKAMALYYDANGNYGYIAGSNGGRYRIKDQGNPDDPQINVDQNYPGGPFDCSYPFGAYGALTGADYTISGMIGKAMLRTDKFFQNQPMLACAISTDKQSFAIAFFGMKSGPVTYCIDSSGNSKSSNIAYSLSTFTTAAFNFPSGGPVSCL